MQTEEELEKPERGDLELEFFQAVQNAYGEDWMDELIADLQIGGDKQ